MNKILSQIFLYLCVALFCASCDNDGDTIYVDGMAPSELIATTSEVKLDVSQRAKIVMQLAWKNPTLLSSDENNLCLTTSSRLTSRLRLRRTSAELRHQP